MGLGHAPQAQEELGRLEGQPPLVLGELRVWEVC